MVSLHPYAQASCRVLVRLNPVNRKPMPTELTSTTTLKPDDARTAATHSSTPNALTYRSGKRSILEHGSQAGDGPLALQFLTNMAIDLSRGPVDLPCFPNVV